MSQKQSQVSPCPAKLGYQHAASPGTPFVLLVLLLLVALLLTTSCSKDDSYDFSNGQEALKSYREYLSKLREIKTSNTTDFTKELKDWKGMNDTVYKVLQCDSAFCSPHSYASDYFIIHDSVRMEMLRLAETWRYSYEDVLDIKEETSSFRDDKDLENAAKSAAPFFTSLNNTTIPKEDVHVLLTKYRYFLSTVMANGITCKDDMLSFIRQEDVLFRSFLTHLYELDDEPVADITKDTEQICRSIFLAARSGKLSARDAMVYMSIRTNRRLLQNAVVCMQEINKQNIQNKLKANAYIWMIIQPFISIDQFAIALLTPQEKSDFKYLVAQLPKSAHFARSFGIEQRSLNYLLPQQLLKIYILSL